MTIIKKQELLAKKPSLRKAFTDRLIAQSIKGINDRLEDAVSKGYTSIVVEIGQNEIEVYKFLMKSLKEAGYVVKSTDGTDSFNIVLE